MPSLVGLLQLTLCLVPEVPAGLEQLTRLTHLALLRCLPFHGEWQVPAAITHLQALRTLRVWGINLEGRHVGALGALGALRELDLHESYVEGVGWLAVRGGGTYAPLLLPVAAFMLH